MIFFKSLILLLVGLVILVEAQHGLPELSISKEESFRVRVFFVDSQPDATERYRYQLDVAYSGEQRRTLIKYKTLGTTRDKWFDAAQLGGGLPYEGTIIVDDHKSWPLLIADDGQGERWCKETAKWIVERLCGLEYFSSNKEYTLDDDNRIFGPANILFMLEPFKSEYKLVTTLLGLTVRNVPSVMFEHHLPGPDGGQIYVYYAKSQLAKGGKALPLRVAVNIHNGHQMEFDFWSDPRENEANQSKAKESGAAYADELVFDEFFIERARGCGGVNSDDSFGELIKKQGSFSFEARTRSLATGRDMLVQVAYHKKLNMMRVDRQIGDKGWNLLIDFNLGVTHRALTSADSSRDIGAQVRTLLLGNTDANRCISIKTPKNERDLERMLFGSSGRWRYLGLARVRGLRARAYEAHDTNWPMWMDQPVSYTRNWIHDKNDLERIHEPRGDSSKPTKLTVVAYLADDVQMGDAEHKLGQLIYMDIFIIDELGHNILRKKSVSLSNFDWKVNRNANWLSMGSIFSMADKCDVSEETNQHLSVSMSLTRRGSSSYDIEQLKDSLSAPGQRDLALIQSLQEDLGLPSSMIYDLESKLLLQQPSTDLALLGLNFRLAKSRQPLVRLRFFGTGALKREYRLKMTEVPASLRDCYYLAAHQKVNTFFGYSESKSFCLVDLENETSVIVHKIQLPTPKAFDVFSNGPLSIYLVHHAEPEEEPDLVAKLKDASMDHSIPNQQLMKRLFLPNHSDGTLFSFIIKYFQVTDAQVVTQSNTELASIRGGNKFYNIGLIPDSKLTRAIELKDEKDVNHWRAIDFGTCQTACLVDVSCRAFSFCSRGSQAECVLTSVELKDTNLEVQIGDILKERVSNESSWEFSLKVSSKGEEIRMRQHASCELHNKSHLGSFKKTERRLKINRDQLVIEPVTKGPDECAARCFEQTLKVIEKFADVNKLVSTNLEGIMANSNIENGGSINDISGIQRRLSKELCMRFSYLNSVNLAPLSTKAMHQFQDLMSDTNENVTGFCITAKPTDQSKISAAINTDADDFVSVEEFSFKFETIYEKQSGVRLLASKMTPDETEIYRLVSNLGQLPSEPSQLDTLRALLARGDNTQTTLTTGTRDETICAMACTLHTSGPWPSCRSFDLVVLPRGPNETTTFCRMNSISYADAMESKRSDLIESRNTHTKMQWHYEPKFNTLARWQPSTIPEPNIARSSCPTLATCIVLVLGCITGLAVGLFLGIRSVNLRGTESALITAKRHQNDDGLDTQLNLDG